MSKTPRLYRVTRWAAAFMCLVMLYCCFIPTFVYAEKESTQRVKIGWYQSACFQEGMSDEQQKSGYCYEYLQKVADYIDLKYEYVYGGWSELFTMLEKGEIDFLAGVSMTEERQKTMLFPDQAMGTDIYCLYKRADNADIVPGDMSTINGKKIGGIQNNRMTMLAVEWLKANNLDADVVYYNNFEEMEMAFNEGKVDLVTGTQNNLLQLGGISIVAKVGEEPYYLAVNKQREDLLLELNQVLSTLQEMDPYLLQNLQYENYGATVVNRTLTSGEQTWVDSHDHLLVGYLENYAPFCSKGESGQPSGIMIEVLEQVWEELGLTGKVQIEYHPFLTTDELEQELISGNIDVILPVSRDLWYLENRGIDSSSAVITCNETLFFNSRKGSDKIESLAVNESNGMQIVYSKTNYPDAELVFCKDQNACLDAVVEGTADGTIVNGYRTAAVTRDHSYKTLSYVPVLREAARCFGVSESDSSLLLLINHGLKMVGSDYGSSIANKYVAELYAYTTADFIKDNIVWVFFIALGVVSIIIIILLRNVSDHKRYTKELEMANAEQEAQLEEITTLNGALEENQQQLEEAAAEQEAQLEEVTALNAELEANRSQLEKQLAVIGATSQRYFCAYVFNLNDNTYHEVFTLPNMHEMLGSKGDAIKPLELAWRYLVIPEDQAIMKEFHDITKWKDYLRDKDIYSTEYRGVTSGWSRASLYAGKRENGEVTGVVYTLERIHEQKEAEMMLSAKLEEISALNNELNKARVEAEAANNAKTSFLFNMSHDIRTPMNAIIGFRDLLEKHQENPERRADYLKKIEESSSVLLSIINNVLEMARIEKGTIEIDEAAWSADQFNDTLFSIFHEMMTQKGITFTRQIDVKHTDVYIDPIKLREVFINILSNAYKYTNAGGSVNMHLEEIPSDREGYALYRTTITDTGIGMSEDFLPHIFEEFSRENTSTENKIEGTGLGMPIVKRLVDLMDGTIEVRSKKGVGSTFIVTLPHRIAEKSDYDIHEGAEFDSKLFKGKRILLAEDNDLNAEIAREILGEAGFMVDRAEDGKICCEKLSSAAAHHYDLILMDVQMPNMNGYEATRTIRKMDDLAKANIPILAMTANAFEEDKREALRSGMNGHLAKPINVAELMKALARVLG